MPSALREAKRALVPLAVARQCFAPSVAAHVSSNRRAQWPSSRFQLPLCSTSVHARSSLPSITGQEGKGAVRTGGPPRIAGLSEDAAGRAALAVTKAVDAAPSTWRRVRLSGRHASFKEQRALLVQNAPTRPGEDVSLRFRRHAARVQHLVIAVHFAIEFFQFAAKNVGTEHNLLKGTRTALG